MKKFISLLATFALAATPVFALAEEGTVSAETSATVEVAATSNTSADSGTTGSANVRAEKKAEMQAAQEKREAALQEKRQTAEVKKQERAATLETKKQEVAERRVEKQNDLIEKAKERADREIARRLAGLDKLSDRILAMKRLSDADKASLEATLSAESAKLAALRIEIVGETSTTTLRTSISSIGKSYRVFALVMPKASITAAADRSLSVAAQLEQVSVKLSARITALKAAGTDTASLDALLADMNAKIVEAKRLAQAAIDQVAVLVPDEGDKAKMAANTAALRSAHAMVKEAQANLKTAHEDARKIAVGLKASGKVEATTETTTQTP